MDLVQGVRHEQAALPALLRTLALLPLGAGDVDAAVDRALLDNPVLERRSRPTCPACGFPGGGCGCRSGAGRRRESPLPEIADDPYDGLALAAACEVAPSAREALTVVLDHLTSRGLLDADPDDIAAVHGLHPDDVAEAVRAVVAAGPPGIAARTVGDLLAAQAVAVGGTPPWVPRLLAEHLGWLASGDTVAAAGRFGVSVQDAEEGFAWVRDRLRPDAGPARPVRTAVPTSPDAYVYRAGSGDLVVQVPGAADLGIHVVPQDVSLDGHPEARAWLERHVRSGEELVRQVDARAATLARVVAEVVQRQRRWFDDPVTPRADLTRAEVAAAAGVHASTVSRAVAGKSLRRPDGLVVDLAGLFGTGEAVRARLRELMATDPDGRPSDARLAARLTAEGLPVARRTVAKYRALLATHRS